MKHKAIPTYYQGIRFRSRLEATWAAFFDQAGWEWKYEPIDLDGWIPDFWVGIPCSHSECCPKDKSQILHELYAEVKPYFYINQFDGHPVTKLEPYSEPVGAKLGVDPGVSEWEMSHGAGGGIEWVGGWVNDWQRKWAFAQNTTQWKGRQNGNPCPHPHPDCCIECFCCPKCCACGSNLGSAFDNIKSRLESIRKKLKWKQ